MESLKAVQEELKSSTQVGEGRRETRAIRVRRHGSMVALVPAQEEKVGGGMSCVRLRRVRLQVCRHTVR